MSAGTVVIAGGILAAVILLTIVAVLCLCRLQYYCCKREESEKEEEEEEPEFDTMSPSHPLALPAPPTPPTPEHYSDEPEPYPPTFLTEANGPAGYSATPPTRRCHRPHAFCPTCARCTLPFYLQHPKRMCNGSCGVGYRTVQQQDLELPRDLDSLYQKLNLVHSVTAVREVVTHSVSTDV